jgi:adenine-specific DNA-methyltransferase
MPRKKRIEQYEHKGKTRVNNPQVGLVDAAVEPPEQKKSYAYDPHLDPELQWAALRSFTFSKGSFTNIGPTF